MSEDPPPVADGPGDDPPGSDVTETIDMTGVAEAASSAVAAPATIGVDDGRRSPWRSRARIIVLAAAGALVGVALAGRVGATVGPFNTTLTIRPSFTGETEVHLAPLGSINLDTHDWPMALSLRVDEIGLDDARRIAEDPSRIETLGDNVAPDVSAAVRSLVLRCVLVALAGAVAGALVAHVSWRSALAGLAVGAVLVAGVGLGTAATFDTNAVSEPRYSGLLTAAPRAVGDVQAVVERYGEYRAQLSELVGNVVTLYLAAEGLPTFETNEDTIRLLHVSDLHLNPQAFDLIEQLTEQFDIDAVVDTGDIVDWGTTAEDRFVANIGRIDAPYVYVRGNHDSERTQRAVAGQPNAVVLDGDAAEVAGLRLWGIGDPRYTPDKDQSVGESEQDVAEAFAPTVAVRLEADEPPAVDVVLIHDARSAGDLSGHVPLVLAGHTHEASESNLDDETLLLVEGSTGGAGLRGLQGEEPKPLAASVLYFDPETKRLVAYDRISVSGLGETGATIERHIVRDAAQGDDRSDARSSYRQPRAGIASGARHRWLGRPTDEMVDFRTAGSNPKG